jgi:activating signal cointegrator complex subunit 1
MSLLSQERIDSALALLRGLDLREMLVSASNPSPNVESKEKEKEPPELKITLKGLKSMHTHSSTSTLFAPPVTSSPTLLNFCQQLKDAFTAAELLVPDSRPLLLHATVVNTIYVPGVKGKGARGGGHGKRKAKLTFDASELLEDWEDFTWVSGIYFSFVLSGVRY